MSTSSLVNNSGSQRRVNHHLYNPYLETDLTGLLTVDKTVSDEVGVHCSCHVVSPRCGSHRDGQGDYVVNGFLDKGNATFFR